MKSFLRYLLPSLMWGIAVPSVAQTQDLWSDTWVATDALGREMPDASQVGLPKTDKQRMVGIFYVTWHSESLVNLPKDYKDVTQVLNEDAEARFNGNSKAWPKGVGMWHWGEPEMGYFLSRDKYVIRKDISMLTDAGVDVLILDATNAVCYWDEWDTLFETMEAMKAEGNPVPKICFWGFNGPVLTVITSIYQRYYLSGRHRDLWFYWDGKPLILCNQRPEHDATPGKYVNKNPLYDAEAANNPQHPQHYNDTYTLQELKDYPSDVKKFFTMKNMWWGYYEWFGQRYVGTEDNWSFGYQMDDRKVSDLTSRQRASTHAGRLEEMAVTPAQHPISITGKSWRISTREPQLDEKDSPAEAYVPWLGRKVKNPEGYGIYFQDRWEEALEVDPDFIYINDWNEWTAGKWDIKPGEGPQDFLGRTDNTFYFVDQYNSEFNRTIQPMKDGYTDNYYMQMAQNIRRYKGARSIPEYSGWTNVKMDAGFEQWKQVGGHFFDTKGDTFHRDHNGYAGRHYTNTTGRNDLTVAKVAVDARNVYFYVETADKMTPYTDPHWMLLFIDADCNHSTGWFGYDYIVNLRVKDHRTTVLMSYDAKTKDWKPVCDVAYRCEGRQMMISLPRKLLKWKGDRLTFDFKWADNPQQLESPISLCTDGDTAPNRRFNYRFIWKK